MNSDPRDYKLDISSLNPTGGASEKPDEKRPYLSVLFECCSVYQRVYRSPADTSYNARCPRCGRTVVFPVGNSGTSARFFRVR
jgi:hypothetical protein